MPRRPSVATSLLALELLCAVHAFAEDPAAAPAVAAPAAAVPAPTTAPAAPTAPTAGGGQDLPALQRDTLFVELSTAGYYELVASARSLGLPDSGSADEIRARLYGYYGLAAPAAAEKGRVVTIERAGDASYAKVEEEEGGIVRASGGVVLSLVETNGDTHRIQADSIVYNRARSTLTARGSVRYERKAGGSTEIFTGEALSADLNDWSGVFLDGKVRTINNAKSSGDRGLVVEADTILRRSANVMVLQNGVISSCDADDPHYAVKAKRIWLLGDKEWAISNAVFSLGNVPILWLPFFYYPGNEIVFHPVIGYRSREGTFLQTTVYLIGAKPAASNTTTLMSFDNSDSAKPTKLKGLFLEHASGPAPKDMGTLKTMVDLYSRLGGFAGISGSFPNLGSFGKTDLYAGVGLSRSLFLLSSGYYSPYIEDGGWSSVWNSSDFLGKSLPLRYGFNFSTSYSAGGLTANLSLPIYSDPYFQQDFANRSEDMDWFNLLNAANATTATNSVMSLLNPKLETSLSLKPKALDPWLSSAEMTKLTTYAIMPEKSASNWNPVGDPFGTLFNVDPNRTFFYPAVFRPFDVAFSFKGTLFNSSPTSEAAKDTGKGKIELRSPWQDSESEGGAGTESPAAGKAEAPGEGSASASMDDFRLPPRAPSAALGKTSAWTGSLGWTLTPSAYYEDSYYSNNWSEASEIDFRRLYSLFSYKIGGTLDGTASYGDFLSSSLSLTYANQNQERPFLYDDGSGTAATYTLADELYQSQAFGQTARLTLKPFASSWLWSGSSLSWDMTSTIYGYKYDSSSSAFKESWISWDPATITAHDLSLTLAIRPSDLTQSLSITATLPPVLESYSGSLGLNAGFSTLHIQSRMYRKTLGAGFSFDPVTTALTVGAAPGPAFTDTFVYDGTSSGPQSNVANFAWGPLSASLTATQTSTYSPVVNAGWVSNDDTAFRISDLGIGLAPQFKGDASATGSSVWSLGANLSLSQSLIRFTESNLGFNLNASLKVDDKLSLTFSSQSLNSAAWRYFPGLFSDQLPAGRTPSDYRVNPIIDIWNSLSLWDASALRNSLFKLKSLSLTAVQNLHDWTLSAQISTTPLLNATDRTYSLDTSFTILLAWKDIPNIKTTVTKTSTTGLVY
jgi:lipopolysaccharide assembly outer membrane protein LptD (OstA)